MGPIARRHLAALPLPSLGTMSPARVDGATEVEGHTDDVHDGPAAMRVADGEQAVRVRLSGHLDPIDGRYHWRGTIFESVPEGSQDCRSK